MLTVHRKLLASVGPLKSSLVYSCMWLFSLFTYRIGNLLPESALCPGKQFSSFVTKILWRRLADLIFLIKRIEVVQYFYGLRKSFFWCPTDATLSLLVHKLLCLLSSLFRENSCCTIQRQGDFSSCFQKALPFRNVYIEPDPPQLLGNRHTFINCANIIEMRNACLSTTKCRYTLSRSWRWNFVWRGWLARVYHPQQA